MTNGHRYSLTLLTSIIALICSLSAQCHAQEYKFPDPLLSYPLGPATDTVRICILGDMMMHSGQIENARTSASEYDFSSYFHYIEDKIKDADIAIANMEYTFQLKFTFWSLYPLVTLVLFGGMLIYLAINKNAREMAKRKLFF